MENYFVSQKHTIFRNVAVRSVSAASFPQAYTAESRPLLTVRPSARCSSTSLTRRAASWRRTTTTTSPASRLFARCVSGQSVADTGARRPLAPNAGQLLPLELQRREDFHADPQDGPHSRRPARAGALRLVHSLRPPCRLCTASFPLATADNLSSAPSLFFPPFPPFSPFTLFTRLVPPPMFLIPPPSPLSSRSLPSARPS